MGTIAPVAPSLTWPLYVLVFATADEFINDLTHFLIPPKLCFESHHDLLSFFLPHSPSPVEVVSNCYRDHVRVGVTGTSAPAEI